MHRIFYIMAIMANVTLLCGCGGQPVPPSKLVKPADVLMVPPGQLPNIREGEDVAQHAATVRRIYGREASKLRKLQRYVRTVTK